MYMQDNNTCSTITCDCQIDVTLVVIPTNCVKWLRMHNHERGPGFPVIHAPSQYNVYIAMICTAACISTLGKSKESVLRGQMKNGNPKTEVAKLPLLKYHSLVNNVQLTMYQYGQPGYSQGNC